MNKKSDFSFEINFLNHLVIGIGEVALIADVPTRQIRYWEEKGIINSLSAEGKNRRYDYKNIKKIIAIKNLLDEGFTLESAAKKASKSPKKANK